MINNIEKNIFLDENQKKIKNSFFEKKEISLKLKELSKNLDLDNKQYIITISSITDDWNDVVKSELIIDEITDILYNMIVSYKQPYLYTKSTIRSILKNLLPYTFFLSLSKRDALKILNVLKKYDDANINAFIRYQKDPNFSIFTWSNAFARKNQDFYANKNYSYSLNFFDEFSNFVNDNYSGQKILSMSNLLDLHETSPIILLSDLKLHESIFVIHMFTAKHQDLPFDLLINDTKSFKRKKSLIKVEQG